MKKHFSKICFVFVLGLLIIPQVTHAAWWKPVTWFNNWTFSASKVENVQTDVKATEVKAVLKQNPKIGNDLSSVNWKHYSNHEYGFGIGYPGSWSIVEKTPYEDGYQTGFSFLPENKTDDSPIGGAVWIRKNDKKETLSRLLSTAKKVSYHHDFKDISVGGQPAFQYRTNEFAGTRAVVLYNGYVYVLTNELVTNPTILSTFKFTK